MKVIKYIFLISLGIPFLAFSADAGDSKSQDKVDSGSSKALAEAESRENKEPHLYGVFTTQGRHKKTQEDSCIINRSPNKRLYAFGVFDGHGGSYVSDFVAEHLTDYLLENYNPENPVESFQKCFIKIHDELDLELSYKQGTTAIVAFLDKDKKILYLNNVGDSRAVLSDKEGHCLETIDHKPTDEEEFKRLEEWRKISSEHEGYLLYEISDKNGKIRIGKIIDLIKKKSIDPKAITPDEEIMLQMAGLNEKPNSDKYERHRTLRVWRYDHKTGGAYGLACSRSIGDKFLNMAGVTPEPMVSAIELNQDEFLILASDGLWDKIPRTYLK